MSHRPMSPVEIIEAAHRRVSEAKSRNSIDYAQDTGRGALGALLDLCLIDRDNYREAVFALDALAASRRQQMAGGAQ